MKKLLVVISILAALCIVFSACGKTEAENETSAADTSVTDSAEESTASDEYMEGMPNPMVEFNSLEEINKKVNVNLVRPAAMGVSDEVFNVINNEIADYKFKIAGRDYSFRAAHKDDDEDISGIYIDGKTAFEGNEADYSIVSGEGYYVGRFFVDDVQYVLSVADDGTVSDVDFDSICLEMRNLIITQVSDEGFTSLLGSYQDKVSMRATAEVKPADKNEVFIEINWGNSADSTESWYITAEIEGDKLVYDADDISHYVTNGDSNPELINDTAAGYFKYENSELSWTGSNSKLTNGCIFVMA